MMVVGTPGSGKSFFARRFADMFAAPIVSYDEICWRLFPETGYTKEEETVVSHLMKLQIDQLIKTQKTFIIDGAVNTRVARMAVERLGKKHDYDTLTVWVQTDDGTAEYRSAKRSPTRDGDKLNRPMPEEIFARFLKRINPPTERENHVVISGKHTFTTQARTVLRKLVPAREATAPVVPVPPIRRRGPRARGVGGS